VKVWPQYLAKGLWGLWREYFSGLDVPFLLVVTWGGLRLEVDQSLKVVRNSTAVDEVPVFSWASHAGLVVSIYSAVEMTALLAMESELLLQWESSQIDRSPTFLPVLPQSSGFSASLNDLILRAPQCVLINGQAGVGKSLLLQCLALSCAGRLVPASGGAVRRIEFEGKSIWIAPEVAMLETLEQRALVRAMEAGDSVWLASLYDVALLKSREILDPEFVDVVLPYRILVPALGARDPEELGEMVSFWLAFYAEASQQAAANLGYYKRRTLGAGQLNVEAILEEGRGLRGVVAEFEKEAILKAHARVGRSQHKIANLLKVSRGSLQHKLRKYQLESFASPDADNQDAE
jgi:hypothetical protein